MTATQTRQTTLRSEISVSGVGVHSGKPSSVRLMPAVADTGVIFVPAANPAGEGVAALAANIAATDLSTVVGDPAGFHVATIEHLMSALFAMGVDNVRIAIDGAEVPIMDGSSSAFVTAIDAAGVTELDVPRKYMRVLKNVRFENGGSVAEFMPGEATRFEVEIDFVAKAIGRQKFSGDLSAQMFRSDIAAARTFGFMKDVERLWAAGFALGSSLENTVVIGDDETVTNADGLRFADEFVRHKTLDAIGDVSLAGLPFIGTFRSFKGGHRMNAAAVRQLLDTPGAFEIVTLTDASDS